MHAPRQAFYLGAGNLNSDPQACTASPWSIDPFPKLSLSTTISQSSVLCFIYCRVREGFRERGAGHEDGKYCFERQKSKSRRHRRPVKKISRQTKLRGLSSGGGEGREEQEKFLDGRSQAGTSVSFPVSYS